MKKHQEVLKGCKFCTDPDFVFRHAIEDDALLRIAEIAVDLLNNPVGVEYAAAVKRLREAIEFFNDLDNHEAQQKRAVKILKEIERDLS